MKLFISPAMASVVVQAQAFFNVALAGIVLKEGSDLLRFSAAWSQPRVWS